MPETTLPQETARQRNWAPWIGLLLAVAAMLSNAGFFLGLPGPELIAWLGVVLAIAALAYAVIGVMRAFRQPQVYGGKVSSSILGVLSLLICGVVAVASISARSLPRPNGAPQVGQKAPDFTLADTSGNKVSLDAFLGKTAEPPSTSANNSTAEATPVSMNGATPPKAVLLVFYRGYW